MAATRSSRQRDAILEEINSRYDHPTAEQIYLELKNKIPSLSLATVYRNLRILKEDGNIISLVCEDAEHFDAKRKMHYHLTCRKCGKIVDVQIENSSLINSLPTDFGGKIEGHSLMFFGLCSECAAKEDAE